MRQYIYDEIPSFFYKAKGYTKKGLVYGTEITRLEEEDIISVRLFTLEPEYFNDYTLGNYHLITEKEYEDKLLETINFLKL